MNANPYIFKKKKKKKNLNSQKLKEKEINFLKRELLKKDSRMK